MKRISILSFIFLALAFSVKADEGPIVFHKGDPHFINHFPDPVNLRSGNMYLPALDIRIPASNVDLTMERFYNSFMSNQDGPLGFGWRHNYMTKVRELTNATIQIEEADGFVTTFVPTEQLKKRLAFEILAKRKKADQGSQGLRSEDYYNSYEAKMTRDTRYLLEQITLYMPSEKSPLGSYFSSQRSNQVLLKQEAGYIRTYLSGFKEYFDAQGLLTRIEDRNSNFTGLSYKGKRLAKIYDRMGLFLSIETLPDGKIQSVKDHTGRVFRYFYDKSGDLVRTVDFSKETEIYAYDAHKLTGITLRNGSKIGIDYDRRMRVVKQTGPGPKNTSYSYGKEEGVMFGEVTDSNGGKTVFKFDNQNGRTVESNALGQSKTTYVDPKTGRLEKVVDETGTANYLKHDDKGNLTEITDSFGYTKSYEYGGPYGMLAAVTEGQATTRFSYDQKGNLIFREMPTGEKYMYRYDVHGNLISYTDPKGNTFSFKYDTHGWMMESVDPLGNLTRYENDSLGRLAKQIDPNGGGLDFGYDNSNNIASIKDPSGRTSTFKYDLNGKLIEAVDARGGKTTYTYNEMGLAASETDPMGSTYRFSYDPMGNLIRSTDPLGNSYTYAYDPLNRLVEERNPLGQSVKYSYDLKGKLKSLTDAKGMTESYKYDPSGRFIGFENPSYGGSYSWKNGEIEFKDARGNITRCRLDIQGRVIKAFLPTGIVKDYQWDHDSRLVTERSSNGKGYIYRYDPNGRLVEIRDSKNILAKYTWDGLGNLVESVNENGAKWSFKYDGVGRLRQADAPDGGKFEMTYNQRGDLASIKDPMDRTQNYRYDMAGKLIARVYPDNTYDRLAYDKASRQISRTMPDGSIVYFEFDAANNLKKVSDGKGSFNQYIYDTKGRIVNAKNNFVSLSYKFDANGNMIQERDDKRGVVTNFTYDRFGRIEKILDGQKLVASYSYDRFGGVAEIRDERDKIFRFEHDGEGLPVKVVYPNSMVTEYSYGLNSLVDMVRARAKGKVFEARYEYDPSGNMTREKTAQGTKEYSYDGMGRLIRASSGPRSYSYDYDKNGNRIIQKAGSADTYEYDSLDRLVRSGDTTYGYNRSGDLITKKSPSSQMSYSYNAFGQLERVTKNGQTVFEAAYDPFGRKYYAVSKGKRSYFRYHALNQIIEETSEGKRLKTFIHKDESMDWPLEVISQGKALYAVRDGKGNTVKLVSERGEIVESFSFEPFGRPLKKMVNKDLAFASRPYDENTGLMDFRYRYYDPETGRFTTRDPVSPASGYNPYVYPSNNPLKYRDPLGLVGFSGIVNRSPAVNTGGTGAQTGGGTSPYGVGPGPNAGGTGTGNTGPVTKPQIPSNPGTPPGQGNKALYNYALFGLGVPWLVKQANKLFFPNKDLSECITGFVETLPNQIQDPMHRALFKLTQGILGLTGSYGSGFDKKPKSVAANFEEFKKDIALFSKGTISEQEFLKKWGDEKFGKEVTGIKKVGLFEVEITAVGGKKYICDVTKILAEIQAAKEKSEKSSPPTGPSNPVKDRNQSASGDRSQTDNAQNKDQTSTPAGQSNTPAGAGAGPSTVDPTKSRTRQ